MLGRLEVALVRRTGRSAVSLVFRTRVLVLETTGRRTGRVRATVLAHHRIDDETVLVVGGAAGQIPVPDWVANLRARPTARVTIDRAEAAVEARELVGAERAQRWSELTRVWPRIIDYQRRSGRTVPVFALRTTSSGVLGPTTPGQDHQPGPDGQQPTAECGEEPGVGAGEGQ